MLKKQCAKNEKCKVAEKSVREGKVVEVKERKPVFSTDLKVHVFYLYVWTYVGICCAVHG